jgi:hypothetical protein
MVKLEAAEHEARALRELVVEVGHTAIIMEGEVSV